MMGEDMLQKAAVNEPSFSTGEYRNVFSEIGYEDAIVEKRIQDTFQILFYGADDERIYHQTEHDMGYIEDTGNHDVRTEGMSYGMMMCVQMDRKKEFDSIWKWARTYMYMENGENAGYFAWSCQTDGTKNSTGPAPDGEEYFAMALFFASNRWGDGEGIFHYSFQAKELLHNCIHKGELSGTGHSMWDRDNKLIKFIPQCNFSDPSYHLPHFYELFALWVNEEDRMFWKEAAMASREYLKKACHPVTGLCAEYADYDGAPYTGGYNGERHDWYYSDSYRTIANIGLDAQWFGTEEWSQTIADNILRFYSENQGGCIDGVFLINGTRVDQRALHPTAVIAVNAQGALAGNPLYGNTWVERFFNTPLREGKRRYYDNCLYFFALLALGGRYRIWK